MSVDLARHYEDIFTTHVGNPDLNVVMIFAAEHLVYLVPLTLLYLWFASEGSRTNFEFGMPLTLSRFTTEDGKMRSVFIFTTIVISVAISYAMGQLYSHPAPYMVGYDTLLTEAPENSFPSQHTTVVFAFVWPLLYLQDRRRTGLVALVLASLVGISRVYVGVHYPIDIVGAIGASLFGFTLVYAARGLVMEFAGLCIRIEDRFLRIVSQVL
ncbi:undecaprenyl-diphosphatase [Natrialba aegyptia]|uniref:PAP2 family protein n=1 Tax=Natrialba aegyptia DSM 13077 TaxID=1227491 RepID=M0AM03_9EURY|nr:undecaprenyl-diphosphatase [Natrialba aegyptia]ELY99549.1 PAP2 family protein [Natrialba aegyptia DSM 13077]